MIRSRIGAYCLCYQEAEWLAANITWMYDRIDVFHVVIGPSDQEGGELERGHYHLEPDRESEEILRAIPDPDRKIRIYTGDSWKTNDVMTMVGTHLLKTDYVLQLDADEFWPQETWDAAIRALDEGADRVGVPHLIFWTDTQHVCEHATGTKYYFCPTRLFRRFEGGTLLHRRSCYINSVGEMFPVKDVYLPESYHLWHFGWVGKKRVLRKFRLHSEARGMVMPGPEVFEAWLEGGQGVIPPREIQMGPNMLTIQDYHERIDPWVENFVKHKVRT